MRATPPLTLALGRRIGLVAGLVVGLVAGLVALLGACASNRAYRIHHGNPQLAVGHLVELTDGGAFEVDLRCVRVDVYILSSGASQHTETCDPKLVASSIAALQLRTPWGSRSSATQVGAHAHFTIDWGQSGIDPLAPDAPSRIDQLWEIVRPGKEGEEIHARWRPSPEEVNRIRHYIGAATDTQYELRRGGPPPSLAVSRLEAEQPLRAGETAQLALTIANSGSGPAFLVSATTRSSVPALHGLRISFGTIAPGASKTRTVPIAIPRENDETSAMVVVNVTEGNDYAPPSTSRRLPIQPPADAPILSLGCHLDDGGDHREGDGGVALIDAGAPVHLRCSVRNAGAAARSVRLSAAIAGGSAVTSPPRNLPRDGTTEVELRLDVPANARMDQRLTLTATLEGPDVGHGIHQELTVQVARPRVCPDGKLTRAQYRAKLAELQKALQAGALTQAELDAYDAELVSCIE
jgi:hypothetical protein